MRGLAVWGVIGAFLFAQECSGVVLYYDGGYCILRYNYSDEVDPDYYYFRESDGRLWLYEPGNWWAQYNRIGGGRADIPEVSATTMYGDNFRLILYGKNLTQTCYFNNVQTTQNNVELVLEEGGSLQSGVTFLAPNSTMVNSRIEGNMAGTLRLEKIAHGTLWTDLTIEGNLTGLCDVEEITGDAMLRIYGDVESTGRVELDGNLDGRIRTWGHVNGVIDIPGNQAGAVNLHEGNLAGQIVIGGSSTATIDIAGTLSGSIEIGNSAAAGLIVHGGLTGDIDVAGNVSSAGYIRVYGNLSGTINLNESSGDTLGSIRITQDIVSAGMMRVFGNLRGCIDVDRHLFGRIRVLGDLDDGRVHIDGSLENGVSGPEIRIVGQMLGDAAIAVDYDGWHELDSWKPGATVSVNGVPYDGNEPPMHIWEITGCKGDMNNDTYVDSDDVTAFDLSVPDYAAQFPGLLGSRDYHADMDCEGYIGDAVDRDWLQHFATPEGDCCFSDCDYGACLPDTDRDGDVDLPDLAVLLSNYGTMSGMLVEDGDFDGDGDVDLTDLSILLNAYGGTCDCFLGGGRGGGGEGRSSISVYVEAYDTGGYTGGGFKGEVDHFVFDLKIELSDPNDDWVATGAELDRYNDATFRLSTTPTTPDQYATFVAAPWTSVPESATASVAGTYDPPDPDPEFTTTGINLAWYDTADSNDGPATIMRIVIDVSDVEGADVSEGFGSVYFSTTGKTGKDDILVADLASGTATADLAPGLKWLSGEFYVKGEE